MPELTTFQELLNNLSKRSFIGRIPQLTLFQNAFLTAPLPTFLILNVYGQAGVGKSCLLNEMAYIAQQSGAKTAVTDDTQFDIAEIISQINEQLSIPKLQPTATNRLQKIKTLSQKLVKGLDDLAYQKRVILFFDNFQTTGQFLESWLLGFMKGEYGRFNGNVHFVIASREPLGKKWLTLGRALHQIELPPFNDSEAASFLYRANINDKKEIVRLRQESKNVPGKLTKLTTTVKPMPAGHTESLAKQAYQHFNERAFPQALNEFNQAIQLQPDNDYLYHWRGRTYWEGKNSQAALADFSKAIALRPNYVNYYHWRGLAYRKARQYEYALEDFSKAIELQPGQWQQLLGTWLYSS